MNSNLKKPKLTIFFNYIRDRYFQNPQTGLPCVKFSDKDNYYLVKTKNGWEYREKSIVIYSILNFTYRDLLYNLQKKGVDIHITNEKLFPFVIVRAFIVTKNKVFYDMCVKYIDGIARKDYSVFPDHHIFYPN